MADNQGNEHLAPGTRLPPGEPERSLRISIWDGACATLHGALSGGALIPAYALMLGAGNFHLGLLAALPALSTVSGIVSSQIVARVGNRKLLTIVTGPGGRLLLSTLFALPFLHLLPGWRLAVFMGTVFLSSLVVSMSGNPWTSWMTDLVPPERRGRYFSVRNAVAGGVSMVAVFGVGKLYDFLKPRVDSIQVFVPFYAGSIVFAIATAALLRRIWEPPLRDEPRIPIAKTISIPWVNPDFRRLLLFSAAFTVACSICSPFLQPHMLKNLHMSMTSISAYYMLFQGAALCTLPLWGRLADRLGNRPILIFTAAMLSFLLVPWLIAAPGRIWVLWIDAVVSGCCWPGFSLAAFNLMLGTAPRQNRSSFIAVHSITAGLSGFAGSLLGGFLAQRFETFSFSVGDMRLNNFHLLFFITMLARFSAVPLAIRLRERESKSVGMLVYQAANGFVGLMNATLQTGITIIRKIARK